MAESRRMHRRRGGLTSRSVKGEELAAIQPARFAAGKTHILYDAAILASAPPELFDPDWLRARSRLSGSAPGRGTTWFFQHEGKALTLRHYRRGGTMETLLEDRFLWTGPERSRAFREWRLLAELVEQGLPVPAPAAARVVHEDLFYRADLITHRIPDAQSLTRTLTEGTLPATQWQEIGLCIRRFHDAGVRHADLNAHNILLDAAGRIYLIDFDKAVRYPLGDYWPQANLARLHRSLEKLRHEVPTFHYAPADFAALEAGYRCSD